MDQLIAELNQVTPLQASIRKIYPETVNWRYRLGTTRDYLEVRGGLPDSGPIELPQDDRRPTNAGIELWVKTTAAEASFIAALGNWNVSHDLLKQFLIDSDAEVADLVEDASVTAIGPWLVVAIGQPVQPR